MDAFIKEYGLVLVAIIGVAAVLIVGNLANKYSKQSMASSFNTMMFQMGTVEHPGDTDTTEPDESEVPEESEAP